jgi:uncharacterized membrane protein YphA (DoxX/SURF4 family)
MAYYVIVCRDCGRNRIAGTASAGPRASFDQIGLRPGRLHAWAAAFAETVGGTLLGLGLFTPIGAALVIAVMTAAVITVHGWALIALGAGILGGIGAVIQGRASSTSHVDQTPPATA